MASTVVNALFGSYDLRNAKQWRDEDLIHRDQEIQWLNDDIVRAHEWRNADIERLLRKEKLENEHLVCAARADQLATISEQCTLLCGFTVASMVNMGFPEEINRAVLILYSVSAAAVCVALLLCTLISTILLLAVTKYVSSQLELDIKEMDVSELEIMAPFTIWWLKKCDSEQRKAYALMLFGVTLFFVYLAALSWVQFIDYPSSSITISSLSCVGFLFWQLRVSSKWRYLLTPPASSSRFISRSSVLSNYDAVSITSARPSLLSTYGVGKKPGMMHKAPLNGMFSPAEHVDRASLLRSPYGVKTSANYSHFQSPR